MKGCLKVSVAVLEKEKKGFREKEKGLGFESLARRLEDQTLFVLAQIWRADSLQGALQS